MLKSRDIFLLAVLCVILSGPVFPAPFDLFLTYETDFSGGSFNNIELIPDPALPDAALILSEFDTIRVLQIIPTGHCVDCIDITVDSLAPYGNPPLNFDIEITTIDRWNDISSLTNNFDAADPITLDMFSRTIMYYDIIYFGIANGYGGRGNDLDNSGRNRVREFAALGRGIVLTHDTIAKRHGWDIEHPLCSDMYDFEHPNFNSITDVTGLTADWVSCYAPDPDSQYFEVFRHPGAPVGDPILHAPFELPDSFTITACHHFGEEFSDGQIWFEGPGGQLYMHTYHSPSYGSYAAYFSTGHEEEYHGDAFRPAPWEGKAMINAMYYAYFGGRGTGFFTSVPFMAICPGELVGLSFDVDTLGGASIIVELAASPDGFVWTDWYVVSPGSPIPAPVVTGPYYKYKILMERSVYGDKPVLHSITWHFDIPSPELELVMPPLGSFYSCSCGAVIWNVHTESGLDLSSVSVVVNSTPYGPSRCSWDPVDSTFEFLGPVECWTHGETYEGMIIEMTGLTGCPRIGDTTFLFTSDLLPPTISNLIPYPGSIIADSNPFLMVTIRDSTSDELNSAFFWVINGDTISYGEAGLSWNGTTDELTLNTIIAGITVAGTVFVCAGGADIAVGCGPNEVDSCWFFIVDTTGPQVEMISPPTGYLSCDSLMATFFIFDIVGVDSTSIIVSVDSDTFTYPTGMSFSAGTLWLAPGLPVYDGDTIFITFENLEDLLENSTEGVSFQIIVDQSSPVIWETVPPPGGYVGVSAPSVSFRLADSISGLNTDSVTVEVDGVTYILADGSWDGEQLILDGSALGWDFEHDDTIEVCVHAEDNASGCGPNELDSCWHFFVNLRGPECYPIGPLDGWIVGCDSFHILFILTDPNGVDISTIAFTINGVPYSASSAEVMIFGDTVDFTPSTPWTDGEVVHVQVTSADDSLGNELEVPCDYSFTVDLTPPSIIPLSPPPDGVVDTTQPIISALITDDAGIAETTLVLCVNGECWGYDSLPPGLTWTGDTLIFDPTVIGYVFDTDTVFVIIEACDGTQWCGPNCADTNWMFLIDNLGPRAFLVEPDSGTFSSCSFQVFAVRVLDPSGLIMDSLEILVDGNPVRWPDPTLDYIGDTLVYTPPAPWNHLDTVTFELISACDSVGNALQDTIYTEVIIDLMPPFVEIITPMPGDSLVLPQDEVRAVILDDGCGLDLSELEFYANGQLFPLGTGLEFAGDTLVFDPATAGFHFPEGETASVQIVAYDCAGYCPPNVTDTTWIFFVPDDDTIAPVWIDYAPALWLEDSVFTLTCRAFDESGIYISSPPDIQAPFVIWDNDAEIVLDCDTAWLDFAADVAGTVTFVSSTPLYSADADSDIVIRASCWDDDFDFTIAADRTRGDSPLWFVEIVARANILMTLPEPGWVTSCRDQTIRFSVSGEVELNFGSCVFAIDGDTMDILHPDLEAEGDSVFIYTPPGEIFDDGAVVCLLIEAEDALGNPLYVPIEWIFYVDTEPPLFTLIDPGIGEMVPENDYGFTMGISDPGCGVDEDYITIAIVVEGDTFEYIVDSTGVYWDSLSGLLEFVPQAAGLPAEDGDSLELEVCAGDAPDLCPPNIGCYDFSYWIEPHVECSTSTNPFTPNSDGYNDEVMFFWPHFFRDGAQVEIYDMRGAPIKRYRVPAGDFKAAAWDGFDDNGRKCPGGVYVYIIEVNGKRICSGTITLAR